MKVISIVILSTLIAGCATPGYVFEDKGNIIEMRPKEAKRGILGLIWPASMPAGRYECEFKDKKAKVDSRTDLRLIDINLNKLEAK